MVSRFFQVGSGKEKVIRITAAVAAGLILAACGDDGRKKKEEEPVFGDCESPIEAAASVVSPAVAAGSRHSYALRSDGIVCAWGENSFGQLGDGTDVDRPLPVKIDGLSGIMALSSGHNHGIALKDDGTVWTWGSNTDGQLGDGTTQDRFSPVQVDPLGEAVAVAAGESHSVVLLDDGTVRAWGRGDVGQLGDSAFTDSPVPVPVTGLSGIMAIASGANHVLAIDAAGEVWTWGYNANGELGMGVRTPVFPGPAGVSVPAKIAGFSDIEAVSGGRFYSLALRKGGSVYAWGDNTFGQLGNDDSGSVNDVLSPSLVLNFVGGTAVSAGLTHSMALEQNGTVWSWGDNFLGKLGDGTTVNRLVPVQVGGLNDIAAIAGGGTHSLALSGDGTVRAWGDNQNGQLGDDLSVVSSTFPVAVQQLVVDVVP